MLRPVDPPHQPWLDQLSTPILIAGPDGIVRYANPALARWLGVNLRRLIESSVLELPPDGARLAQAVERSLANAATVEVKGLLVSVASDAEHPVDAICTPDPDGDQVLVEFRSADAYPGADPSRRLPEALSATLRGLAHELRNPLAGLRGAAQLISRQADPQVRRYADVIVLEVDRLSALTERMLLPQPARPPEPVNVHAVIEQVRVLAEHEAAWSAVIHRDYDPSLPDVQGDADRLVQAVWNLVRNALEAGASEIRLRTRAEHHVRLDDHELRLALRLDVIDNGCGVPDSLADRIFLPMVSGREQGTGLGLALAQQIAREHGGMLSFRSRPGLTVFTLMVPIAGVER